jgi:hypothetical protein
MASRFSMDRSLLKPLLFIGAPFATISGFSQYHSRVAQLPAVQHKKIAEAAEFVITSYVTPAATGGFVVAIGVRGHADKDLAKQGTTRTDFEQKISEDRARDVAAALLEAIDGRAFRLPGVPSPEGDPFQPIVIGVGATMLARPHPMNEQDRAANRRVEIFFLRDFSALAQSGDFPVPPQKSFSGPI